VFNSVDVFLLILCLGLVTGYLLVVGVGCFFVCLFDVCLFAGLGVLVLDLCCCVCFCCFEV